MEAVRYKENESSQLFPKTEAVSCFRKRKQSAVSEKRKVWKVKLKISRRNNIIKELLKVFCIDFRFWRKINDILLRGATRVSPPPSLTWLQHDHVCGPSDLQVLSIRKKIQNFSLALCASFLIEFLTIFSFSI